MRLGNYLFMLFLIILSLYNCARQILEKPITEKEVLDKIPHWQEEFNKKSGTGEIIISGPEYRYSSYFSFNYNANIGALSGKLLGSFGLTVGTFYFSPESVSVVDREGRKLNEQVLLILGELPMRVLPRYITWDIPLSYNWRVIPLSNGWVLVGSNIEVSVSREFLPTRVLIRGESDSSVEYSSYRRVRGVKHPFRVIVKKGKNMLEIEHYTMRLQ